MDAGLNPTHVERVVSPASLVGTIAVEIAKNFAMTIPVIRKVRTRLGRTITAPSEDQLDRYAFRLFDAVQAYCGGVRGKSVLEIGPGDNLVTGLAFVAAGVKSYTVIDRFPGAYGSAAARAWYKLLADNWPYGEWPADLDPERFPEYDNVFTKDRSVENTGDLGTYDIVCSYHVGEHVTSVDAFARLTRTALAPGAVALHEIDFGGHQWNRFGDPFLFLKFPDLIWALMGSARGEPNRVRFGEYVAAFERAGLTVDVPRRRQCQPHSSDRWVRARADDSFLTTDATFVLKAR